jgi:hypothetical protein
MISRNLNTDKRKIRYFERVRSDTDEDATPGIWCPRVGKYVKEAGAVDGITDENAQYPVGKPKYQVIPSSVSEIDGY